MDHVIYFVIFNLLPQCQVMYCFTEMLRNFLAVELPRQQELLQEERSQRARDLTR